MQTLDFHLLTHDASQAPSFGHLARAGAVIAGTPGDHQHLWRRTRVGPAALCRLQAAVGVQPLRRYLVGGVRERRSGSDGMGRLAPLLVGVPGNGLQPQDGRALTVISGVYIAQQETFAKHLPRKASLGLAGACFDHEQSPPGVGRTRWWVLVKTAKSCFECPPQPPSCVSVSAGRRHAASSYKLAP